MKKIVFFGGTFDPPHLGHSALAESVLSRNLADEVLFVPAYAPAHKSGMKITPYADRLAMLHAALDGRAHMHISEIERELGLNPSYSIDILHALQKRMENAELLLLIGSDSLLQLHSWHRARELAQEFRFLVFPRRDAPPDPDLLKQHWCPEMVKKLLSGVMDGPFYEISSTEIRKKLVNHENTVTFSLDQKVLDYIRHKELYERTSDMTNLSAETLAKFIVETLDDKKADQIVCLNVGERSSVADFFILCTANSTPQLKALESHVARDVRERFERRPSAVDGDPASGWILMDFSDVCVHIMTAEIRTKYQLESLWGDAPKLEALETIEQRANLG